MKRTWIIALTVVVLLLAVAACGGDKTTPEPAAEPVKASSEAGEPAEPAAAPESGEEMAEPTEEPEPTLAPEPTSAPEEADLSLDDRSAGLDQLTSYRVTWKSNWESTKDGTTKQASWDWLEEFTADPEALHFIWKSAEDGADKGSMEMWQIGDTMYLVSVDENGTSECTSISSSDPDSGFDKGVFNPSMLGGLSGAKYAGRENVNGIAAKHYKYDEKATSLSGFGKVSGETWVAEDGGYVVKELMNWEGSGGLFGMGGEEGETGKGQWEWELKDPNGAFTINPPEGCENASAELPILPDAKEKTAMGDLVMYQTATPLADALAFYQKEMAAAGWEQKGEPTSMEGFAAVEFTKDNKTASINITGEGETIQVMISVTEE